MKKILGLILVFATVFVTSSMKAQGIEGIVSGLRNGNATEIAKNAGANFYLTVLDKSDSYSKDQAQLIIKEFFGRNSVKGFEVKHKGNSPNGQYAIGTLSTSNGNYRVNIFMKKQGAKEVIKELRIQLLE